MRADEKTRQITTEDRIKFGTKIFNILACDNVEEANVKIRLTCMQAV